MDRTPACGAGNAGSIPAGSTEICVADFCYPAGIEGRKRVGAKAGSRKISAEIYV